MYMPVCTIFTLFCQFFHISLPLHYRFSALIEVGSPCPGYTRVFAGSVNNLSNDSMSCPIFPPGKSVRPYPIRKSVSPDNSRSSPAL